MLLVLDETFDGLDGREGILPRDLGRIGGEVMPRALSVMGCSWPLDVGGAFIVPASPVLADPLPERVARRVLADMAWRARHAAMRCVGSRSRFFGGACSGRSLREHFDGKEGGLCDAGGDGRVEI